MLLSGLGILLVLYAGLCGLFWSVQRSLLYFPGATRVDARQTDFTVQRPDAVLRGWVLQPGRADPILYFGGNAEAVEFNRDDFARWFPQRSVYLLAYRGFGASDGEPSQAALYADALAFHDAVQQRHPGQRISVIGRSLGSGMASYLAAHRTIDRLVLVTPYDSMQSVAQSHFRWLPVRWLLRDRYPSARWLPQHHGTMLIVQAGRDTVIPATSTHRLIQSAPRPPQVLLLPDAGHDDVSQQPDYGPALASYLR